MFRRKLSTGLVLRVVHGPDTTRGRDVTSHIRSVVGWNVYSFDTVFHFYTWSVRIRVTTREFGIRRRSQWEKGQWQSFVTLSPFYP